MTLLELQEKYGFSARMQGKSDPLEKCPHSDGRGEYITKQGKEAYCPCITQDASKPEPIRRKILQMLVDAMGKPKAINQ